MYTKKKLFFIIYLNYSNKHFGAWSLNKDREYVINNKMTFCYQKHSFFLCVYEKTISVYIFIHWNVHEKHKWIHKKITKSRKKAYSPFISNTNKQCNLKNIVKPFFQIFLYVTFIFHFLRIFIVWFYIR